MKNSRVKHTAAFKAKVALAVIREQETVAEIARRHNIHPVQVYKWKKEFLENMVLVFEKGTSSSEAPQRESELLKKIGELTMERDFLSRGLGRLS